jgi:hypothetical protein
MKGRDFLYVVFALGLFAAYPAHALEVGLRDDSQYGTTQGWETGVFDPNPPANVVGEGGDRYLQVTSRGGQGPGSRLSVFNIGNQWAGDYTEAGITALSARIANFGDTDVDLRLLLADPQELGQIPENVAVTTGAVHLPAGSDWTDAVFPITPGNLTVVEGDVGTLLAGVTELRLFHNPAPDFPAPPIGPPSIVAQIGIDDVTAIPEPATAVLLAIGAGELIRRRRRA